MRTRLTLQPGQPGTKQLVAKYGAEPQGTPCWLRVQIRPDGADSSPQVSEWEAGRTWAIAQSFR